MWWFFEMDNPAMVFDLELDNLAKVREMTNELCNGSDSVIRKSLMKLYPDLGQLSAVLQIEEIIRENIPQKEELEERDIGYFFGGDRLITSSDKKKVEKIFGIYFEPEPLEKVRVLNGLTAYRGKVRGFVRRVMGHKQIDEVQEGEILISPMTIPDFVPAMKKAGAIVTDEGGMLSHAAIVAREFQTPTVVGTSIATKRLRTGDIVEVNATEGKVSLICHATILANKLKKPCIIGTHFATDMFSDGDYVEVDADAGTITLLNRKDKVKRVKKEIPWNTLFQ